MRNFVCQWNWRGSVGPPGTRSGEEPGRPRGGAANRCGGREWSALESIEDALAQCLELTENQKLDVEACVAQYPQWEDELRQLLRLALAIRSLDGQPDLSPELVRRIRERIFSVRDRQPNPRQLAPTLHTRLEIPSSYWGDRPSRSRCWAIVWLTSAPRQATIMFTLAVAWWLREWPRRPVG